MAGLAELLAPVTVVTGAGRGSGKTTLVGLVLPQARRRGPVGLFTIGIDGGPGQGSGSAAAIGVAAGDCVVTTEGHARSSQARFEILDALDGRSASGRLLLGRARRAGTVTLVGPEHLSTLASALASVAGVVSTSLVDGAVSRLTQLAALDAAAFVHTASVTPATLDGSARHLRTLESLADLPVEPEPAPGVVRLEGPLTASTLEALGPRLEAVSLADLTQNFLDPAMTERLLGRVAVSVRRGFDLRGIAVCLRGVTRAAFGAALGREPGPRYRFDVAEVQPC